MSDLPHDLVVKDYEVSSKIDGSSLDSGLTLNNPL